MLREGISIQAIRDLVKADFDAVNQLIAKRLYSKVNLIQEIAEHIIHSGGKRLRPLLVLLCARALNYSGRNHIELAAVIEFIHTATLLHDDVVDASMLRRGLQTANAIWGNDASILVGDFLYSRSFQMMANLQNMRVMEVLADATNQIAEGEVLQLMNRHNLDADEAIYMEVIRCKTAKLFEAATQLGAIAANAISEQELALATYGLHLGIAYQLIDDVLDYTAATAELGKNLGDDLAEGKPTLPLIYALQHGTAQQAKLIRDAILNGGLANLTDILEIMETTGAFAYARQKAQYQADLAIASLSIIPESPFRSALKELAQFAIERRA